MSKCDIDQEILEGVREIKACKNSEKSLRAFTRKMPASPKIIREK